IARGNELLSILLGWKIRCRPHAERKPDDFIGDGSAVRPAARTSNRRRHPAVHRRHIKGVFLAAATNDFNGNYHASADGAKRFSPQKRFLFAQQLVAAPEGGAPRDE